MELFSIWDIKIGDKEKNHRVEHRIREANLLKEITY